MPLAPCAWFSEVAGHSFADCAVSNGRRMALREGLGNRFECASPAENSLERGRAMVYIFFLVDIEIDGTEAEEQYEKQYMD